MATTPDRPAAPEREDAADRPATVTDKGAPDPAAPARPHVLDHAHLPVMTLRDSALAHNTAVMQAYVDRHGLLLAPHMKTHMAPALVERQLRAGAWGVTVASVQQAMVAWAHGVRRVLVANEVLDPAGLDWLATRGEATDASTGTDASTEAPAATAPTPVDVLCNVDSLAGVAAASAAQARTGGTVHVLVEVGFPGGRTGVRSPAEARTVAQAAVDAGLVLRGVTGYEGGLPDVDTARRWVAGVAAVAADLRPLVPADRMLLSMGGSAWFDGVVDALADRPADVDVLLRSGAYLTHDDGFYAERTPFGRRPEEGSLRPAIEVWGRVTSCPEPGRAFVAIGKRDVSFDEGLPVVRGIRPGGTAHDPQVVPPPGAVTVVRLDDQHCYLALTDDAPRLTPGDVVVLGVSHPCTVFDKWRQVRILDDDDTVVQTIGTWF
ncbi:alanine racemase [Curtobacterium sp. C1]|uniref:alanine racemase n=1 Tax=Curtobacterium TaxID=2034 RepID=UPI001E5B98A6|nr:MULTISPECIES: alanine racemase [Curtobacterium]UFU13215.1 alanine racemase [Curtobacterium sp. C1]WIJ44429.1 alanine racemase [Curtobacterium citreum]